MIIDDFVWAEKYRPRTIEDLVATPAIKATVRQIIKDGNIPTALLIGPSGVGKTTIARLLVDLLDGDYTLVNSSLKGNIDTLRNEIQGFASAVSFGGGRKYVILDEADGLNIQSTQPALRAFIDQFSKNCGFILTANYENKLLPELVGRTEVYRFNITRDELPELVMQFTKRMCEILTLEGVTFDKKVVAQYVMSKAPNWRAVINEMQKYARQNNKTIDNGILAKNVSEMSFAALVPLFKQRDFTSLRKWIGENADGVGAEIFGPLVNELVKHLTKPSIPSLIIIAARYQYQAAFAVDQQINLAAAFAEIMAECNFDA